jgi:hypothetical protein
VVCKEPSLYTLVANLAIHLHSLGQLGRLLVAAPRHGAIDAVQICNPVGFPFPKLRKVELVLLEQVDRRAAVLQHVEARDKAMRPASMTPHVAVVDAESASEGQASRSNVYQRTPRSGNPVNPTQEATLR